jgi:glycerol dehydrogenase-like iron-containing ADH family enzyme
VREKEARAAAEQVVRAAMKRMAVSTTVVGMGGGTRDLVGAVGGSASAHMLSRNWDECRCRQLSRIYLLLDFLKVGRRTCNERYGHIFLDRF